MFASIVVHLIGKPFDMTKPNTRLLHNLELTALSICWITFWGGLLFFLGHEKEGSVVDGVKVFMTIFLVVLNVVFLIVSIVLFAKECRSDQKKQARRKTARENIDLTEIIPIDGGATQIVPVNNIKNWE